MYPGNNMLKPPIPKSSLRRTGASPANGALSRGPRTPPGETLSSQNAIRHGLLAKCVVLTGESRQEFDALLQQHLDHFAPAEGVDLGYIEEIVAAAWRLRRASGIETRVFDEAVAAQPPGDERDRMAGALARLAARPEFALLHRYKTRLHRSYQRALQNFIILREALPPNENSVHQTVPNEPGPILEHPGASHLLPGDPPADASSGA